MKKERKHQNNSQHFISNIFLLLVLVLGLLIFSNHKNYNYLMGQFNEYISESSGRTAKDISDMLKERIDAIHSITYLYGSALHDPEVNLEYLKELEQQSGFDRIRFIDKDGTLYASEGKLTNVLDRKYFMDGIKGNSGVTYVKKSRVNSQSLLGVYAPVYYNGEICGIMTGFLEQDTISEQLETILFSYKADTCIVDREGDVLGMYKSEKSSEITNLSELSDYIDPSELGRMEEALRNGESVVCTFHGERGSSRGALIPVEGTELMLFQVFPPEAAKEQIRTVNNNANLILFLFGCMCLWFLFLFVYIYKKRAALEHQRAAEERIITLLKNITDDYLCLIDVNLKTETEEQFRILEGFSGEDWAQGNFDYTHCIENYAYNIVVPKDQPYFLTSTKLSAVKDILSKQRAFYIEYDGLVSGEVRRLQGRFTMLKDDPDEPHILIGIRDITEAAREKVRQQISMDLIVSAASTVYPFILEENLTQNIARTVCNQGIVNRGKMEYLSMDAILEDLKKTIIYQEDYEKIFARMNRESMIEAYRQGEHELSLRVRQMGDDGNVHWMETRNILMENEEGDIYSISMTRCIDAEIARTEELQRAKEAAESSNKAKSIFLFNMSHDIRTPMNAIMGFSSMAEKCIHDPEKVLDCMKKINLSGEHLLNLINSVLDMSRIESGKLELDIQAHHIPTEIENLNCIFQTDIRQKNQIFQSICEIDDEVAFYDLLRLNQIKLNLIGNAIKYTPEGGTIIYSVRQISSENGYATYRLSVKDNGIGMSKEFCNCVFDAFERENNSVVAGIQGTGLGLAITKGLITQMNGTITCNSEPGKGSEFVCMLTFRTGSTADVQTEKESDTVHIDYNGRRVLLVEDNVLNREISTAILEDEGFIVDEADNGEMAVEKVKWSRPGYYDLVLMDIQMPKMDGYEATRQIRALSDRMLAQIPIIAVTANAFEEDKRKAFSVGMNGHIAKPIRIEELESVLKKIMQKI